MSILSPLDVDRGTSLGLNESWGQGIAWCKLFSNILEHLIKHLKIKTEKSGNFRFLKPMNEV